MSETKISSGFHEAISRLLSAKLDPYKEATLDNVTCIKIYTTIFDALVELFKAARAPVGNEAANYIAQQYYDGILINNTNELDPNIFNQRAQLSNIPTKELAFLAVALAGTDFRIPVLEEIKKRS